MFTGIIKEIGTVKSIEKKSDGIYFTIDADMRKLIVAVSDAAPSLPIGASVAVDGVCQTVLESNEKSFTIQTIPETLRVTAFGDFKIGSKVNLEPAMKLSDAIDGHLVQGHVDCTGTVDALETSDGGKTLSVVFPDDIEGFIVYKGSITINGVSLTISKVGAVNDSCVPNEGANFLEVSLILHTLENTNLGLLKKGDKVNLEVDMMARYAAKMIEISKRKNL